MNQPRPIIDLAHTPAMNTAGVRRLFAVLKASGGELRFVGGCVRDALRGGAIGDIDLAVNVPPDQVMKILTDAGIKVVPTGLDHGTVTAVVEGKGYEITTLRQDLETDGRHAKVVFTDDWQSDAARRDFTFNALYVDADGVLYDYFNGCDDLTAGHVRFIGNAEARIREDVLRILRFFRFYAWFGRGEADAEGLGACAALAPLLPQLSVERVWNEIRKTLRAPNLVSAWRLMIDHGVLKFVLPEANRLNRLEKLVGLEPKDAGDTALRRLSALLPQDVAVVTHIAQKLHMANREIDKLRGIVETVPMMREANDALALRRVLYAKGVENGRDALLLLAAEGDYDWLIPALAEVDAWHTPVFPIQGEDIMKMGVRPSPQIGAILHNVEQWWMAEDFKPTRDECLMKAQTQL